jgi:AraC family transcriptional regulator, dual regulator of chb operon
MVNMKYTEENSFDREIESQFSFVGTLKNAVGIHNHDFYEFFLITKGNVLHKINGSTQFLSEGHLVFIRPWDTHYYENDGDRDCQFINIPYSQTAITDAFNYLGTGYNSERLTKLDLPPLSELSAVDRVYVTGRLERLFLMPLDDKSQIRIELRGILMELLTQYFPNHKHRMDLEMPGWFRILLKQMQHKEFFIEGLPKMYQLSAKSPGHLNRTFKTYMNMKPTEFVNQLRLNYAKNLLVKTDKEILDISMDAGFENISHFYHTFRRYNRLSPGSYRKKSRSSVI